MNQENLKQALIINSIVTKFTNRITGEKFEELKAKLNDETKKIKVELDDYTKTNAVPGAMGQKGPKGEKGIVGPMGPKGRDGMNGRDGINGENGVNGKDGSSDTPQEIVTKLETLKGVNMLSASAIKDLDTEIKKQGHGPIVVNAAGGLQTNQITGISGLALLSGMVAGDIPFFGGSQLMSIPMGSSGWILQQVGNSFVWISEPWVFRAGDTMTGNLNIMGSTLNLTYGNSPQAMGPSTQLNSSELAFKMNLWSGAAAVDHSFRMFGQARNGITNNSDLQFYFDASQLMRLSQTGLLTVFGSQALINNSQVSTTNPGIAPMFTVNNSSSTVNNMGVFENRNSAGSDNGYIVFRNTNHLGSSQIAQMEIWLGSGTGPTVLQLFTFGNSGFLGIGNGLTQPLSGLHFKNGLRVQSRRVSATGVIQINDYYIGASTGASISLTLPNGSSAIDVMYKVIDESGAAATNSITVLTQAGELINGTSFKLINTNFGALEMIGNSGRYFIT